MTDDLRGTLDRVGDRFSLGEYGSTRTSPCWNTVS